MRQSRNIGFYDETRQFYHGKRADYCVYSDGRVTRTWKKSMVEELVSVYLNKGKAKLTCGNKEFVLKHVVAAAFLPEYRKGAAVICIDRNELNCSVDNLCVMNSKQLGKLTGHMAKAYVVNVTDLRTGKTKRFRSVREAAKALYCSCQTVLDYMKGKIKKGILSDYEIKRIAHTSK